MIRAEKFREIEKEYDILEEELRKTRGIVFDTEKGIYGTAKCDRMYNLFNKIRLQRYKSFLDLGSGDGRVVLIASLFTNSSGIEIDRFLVEKGEKIRNKLGLKCAFIQADFTRHNFSKYDFIFINPDKEWNEKIEKKLLREFNGVLFVNNNIFLPNLFRKGRSYWFGSIPMIRYSMKNKKMINRKIKHGKR
ncbi:MAG: methyltransferase domain-containing protein [Candidatus Woesearchaeota archaeon]|nr:methyltransferase domain-containing protein [Candidatus Woesearchaeota archaeon]